MTGEGAGGQIVPARLQRAASLAAASTLLGVSAHALAGGHLPDLWVTLLAAGVILAAGYALAGRERRLPAIFVGLLAGQAWIHGTAQFAGAGHGTHGIGGDAAAGQWSSTAMIAAHLVAGLVTAAWLRLAEERVFRLARSWGMHLRMMALVGRRGVRVPSVGPVVPPLPRTDRLPIIAHPLPVMGMRAPPTGSGSIVVD